MASNQKTAPGRTPGSEAILAEARRGLMLVSLVERHIGADNLRKNGAYRYEANSAHCPCCRREGTSPNALSIFVGQDGNWRWKCQSCGEGGTAIDWMIAVSGNNSVLEAAKEAVGGNIAAQIPMQGRVADIRAAVEADLEKARAMTHVLGRLRGLAGVAETKVVEYLRGRGITLSTIGAVARNGMLRMLPAEPYKAHRFMCDILANDEHSGEAWLKMSGLMKDDARFTALAYRPLLFIGSTWLEARIIHAPRDKEPKAIRYGSTSTPLSLREGTGEVNLITTVEGPIDFLSKIQLGLRSGQIVVGIPGVTSWKPDWLTMGAKAYPGATWELALDNDEPGHEASDKMGKILNSVGAKWFRSVPFAGKDLNDELMSRLYAAAA